MAGGLVYTAVGSEAMATAEYYGKAMCDLGKEHPEIVALTADLAGSTKIGVFPVSYTHLIPIKYSSQEI